MVTLPERSALLKTPAFRRGGFRLANFTTWDTRERGAPGKSRIARARPWPTSGEARYKRQEAHDPLDWCTEGFDTADLKEAKALLEELK